MGQDILRRHCTRRLLHSTLVVRKRLPLMPQDCCFIRAHSSWVCQQTHGPPNSYPCEGSPGKGVLRSPFDILQGLDIRLAKKVQAFTKQADRELPWNRN